MMRFCISGYLPEPSGEDPEGQETENCGNAQIKETRTAHDVTAMSVSVSDRIVGIDAVDS